MKAQEFGYLKDISCFEFKECDVENIVFLFKRMNNYIRYYSSIINANPDSYMGYQDFYDLFRDFYYKIDYVSDSDSGTDSEDLEELRRKCSTDYRHEYVSVSVSDSDSDSDYNNGILSDYEGYETDSDYEGYETDSE